MLKKNTPVEVNLVSRIWNSAKSRVATYSRKVKKCLGINIEYSYGKFSILLPADHMLPAFQKFHPLYDRFLPHLCGYLGSVGTVIDVGANCGDTLAAMFSSNKRLSYVCVEPDDFFYTLLTKNIKRISQQYQAVEINTYKSLIGKSVVSASLEGINGTKRAVVGEGVLQPITVQKSRTLDSIVSEANINNVLLLKSDVDGFDYDVLDSANSVITQQTPILFFECQLDFNYQKAGFEKTIDWLKVTGYETWVVFDNFGELVLQTDDVGQVKQLLNYTWRMGAGHSTVTFPYFDLLAATNKNHDLLSKVLHEYIAIP